MASRNLYKLFVGNLPWTVGHMELRQYFAQFGYVTNSTVIFDHSTGMSKGFGFINFGNKDAYHNALNKSTHLLEGHILDVNTSK